MTIFFVRRSDATSHSVRTVACPIDWQVMAPIEDGTRLKSAEAQVELLRLQEATVQQQIQIELDSFVN